MCLRFPTKEWSGLLFYYPEGTFKDNTLTIKCVDFFLMDIGSSGFTEFSMGPETAQYLALNPHLFDAQMGLIHSHNTMKTFFSGTDMNTLKTEGSERNHFVSLIVNNEGTYSAAITRKVKIKRAKLLYSYPSFNGEVIEEEIEEGGKEKEEVWGYDLKVTIEGNNEYLKVLSDRITELEKASIQSERPYLNYVDPRLFKKNDYPVSPKKPLLPEKYTEPLFKDDDDDLDRYKVDSNKIKALGMQLLTGSIIASDKSKVDLDKWLSNMEAVFNRRFSEENDGKLSAFELWADPFIEYLCWNSLGIVTEPDGKEVDDVDVEPRVIATHLIKFLEGLGKTNKYIEKYIELLESILW